MTPRLIKDFTKIKCDYLSKTQSDTSMALPRGNSFVTHKGVAANVNTAVYVKFIGANWQIFTESAGPIAAGEIYNVLVIKQ